MFLLKFFAIKWRLVPHPGYTPIADGPGVAPGALSCPGSTLALLYMAGYVRMTRAFVLESHERGLRPHRAGQGPPARRILFKHSCAAALTPLVTLAGLDLAGLLGGAIITETVFNYKGSASWPCDAITTLDLPIDHRHWCCSLAAFVIIANIIVDMLYAFIDPRVRVG